MTSNMNNKKPIKVSVAKECMATLVGVTLRQDSDEDILINTIAPNSLFANTRLEPGMEVLKINGVSTDCLSLKLCMQMLRNAADVATIEALEHEGISSSAQQSTASDPAPAAPVPSAPYQPDPEPMCSSHPPIFESNQEPTLILPTAITPTVAVNDAGIDEDVFVSCSATPIPSNMNGFPVASAHLVVGSTRSAISVDAAPIVAAFAASPVVLATATTPNNTTTRTGTGGVRVDVIDHDGTVTVTANKPNADTLAGIGLSATAGVGVVISSFKTFSIFNGTNLRVGMKIIRINDETCTHQSAEYIATLLRSIAGDVTIVARDASDELMEAGGMVSTPAALPLVTALVTKPSQQSKVGIGVCEKIIFNGTSAPVITRVEPDGLSAFTPLMAGMRVLSINGVSCLGRDDTIAMLGVAQGTLAITAGPLGMVFATVMKPSIHEQVGLVMRIQGDMVVISKINSGGLCEKTALRVGMRILQVNGEPVDDMAPLTIASIMASSEGSVTVLAEDMSNANFGATTIHGQSDVTPPGVQSGGQWGTGEYQGPTNSIYFCIVCALCGIFGMCTLCCLMDRGVMYLAPNGRVYDAQGRCQGSEAEIHFRFNPRGVLGPQKLPESEVEKSCGPNYAAKLMGCGCVTFVAWIIFVFVVGQTMDEEEDYSPYSYP